ncbi:MAG: RNA polymerase sigma factor [Clostridiales bacterium]|nr:RNA polymerase sigma factor [Clostridiales bacterium]
MALPETQFNEIYDQYADTVYRVCFTYLGNKHDAEDALQQTFMNLLRADSLDSIRHPRAWLITCAKNACADILRRGYRKETTLEEWYAHTDEHDETRELLYHLPKLERLAVYLHYYERYTAAQIGKMIGKSESTVWGYLHKGRKKLKQLIQEAM